MTQPSENSLGGQPLGLPLNDQLGAASGASELCQPEGLKFDAFGEPRTRYVRVTLDGNNCVMTPVDGDRYVQDARDAGDDTDYEVADVYLSDREFEDLPEHDGF